ncbi:His-Xaa-Ser system radical SAM maturase HxsC [Burkholderia sp. BDU5]|nr:His-Xaa-Ser system radical SAM maturase HxsC [Burkholderia sp. BDU5]
MLKLSGKVIEIKVASEVREPRTQHGSSAGILYTVAQRTNLPAPLKARSAYLVRETHIPGGFAHYLALKRDAHYLSGLPPEASSTVLPDDYDYVADGDIIRLNSVRGEIRVLYRKNSPHNAILVTEQCQHYCLMCSQPPKDVDDNWLLDEAIELIRLIPRTTEALGFTGGEPTLYKDRFLDVLRLAKSLLPQTKLHILSNGRLFVDRAFAAHYAAVDHPDMTIGIPVYSDDPAMHDYIVQAKGAFDETIRGILHLKELGQKVEVRVVLHKLSIGRLEKLAQFIARNLLFVDHVALMGLEITGFTRANLDKLWIDPYDYRNTLSRAVRILEDYGMHVSVYNHQLCVVNADIKNAYRKSISDWKNEYLPICEPCTRRHECGAFFSSAIKYRTSDHIRPFI